MTLALLLLVAATFAVAGMVTSRGAALVRALIAGRPVLMSPRCASCGSQLRAAGRSLPEACPECGHATTGPHDVVRARPAHARDSLSPLRRACSLVATAVAVVLALGAASYAAVVAGRRLTPAAPRPAAAAVAVLGSHDAVLRWARGETETMTAADSMRAQNLAGMNTDELRSFVDALLAASADVDRRAILAGAAVELARRDPDAAPSLRGAIADTVTAPRCIASARVVPGGEIVIALVQPTRAESAWISIDGVRLDGQPLDLKNVQSGPGEGLLETGVRGTAFLLVGAVAPAAPGTHALEVDWSADWPIPGPDGRPAVPGLHPRSATERRTLVVAAGPETVDASVPIETLLALQFAERPYLVLVPAAFREPGRLGLWLRFPTMPFAFYGAWSVRTPPADCDGGASPLQPAQWSPIPNVGQTSDPLDVTAAGLVPDPRLLDSETIRVRFDPSPTPHVLPAASADATKQWGAMPSRAYDASVREPIEFVFRRSPVAAAGTTFLLERIERAPPTPE